MRQYRELKLRQCEMRPQETPDRSCMISDKREGELLELKKLWGFGGWKRRGHSGEDMPGKKKTTWGKVGEMWTWLDKLQVTHLDAVIGSCRGAERKFRKVIWAQLGKVFDFRLRNQGFAHQRGLTVLDQDVVCGWQNLENLVLHSYQLEIGWKFD